MSNFPYLFFCCCCSSHCGRIGIVSADLIFFPFHHRPVDHLRRARHSEDTGGEGRGRRGGGRIRKCDIIAQLGHRNLTSREEGGDGLTFHARKCITLLLLLLLLLLLPPAIFGIRCHQTRFFFCTIWEDSLHDLKRFFFLLGNGSRR